MGKLKCFEIILAGNKSVFHPGEKVCGKVVVDLKGDMKMRSLRIFMRGVAKVHWTESRSTGSRLGSYTEHYNAEVEYFFKRQVLFGGEVSEGRDTLTEGRHEFSFSFDLQMGGIATSFEGKHGSIRYWLKAEMDKPWSFNHKTKKAFTVISPIDINKAEYQLCVESSIEKTLCCWMCTSGPISMTARSDRRGYCPGESIAISAEFENHSSRTVIPMATLYQTQAFFANGKSRVRRTKFTVLTENQNNIYILYFCKLLHTSNAPDHERDCIIPVILYQVRAITYEKKTFLQKIVIREAIPRHIFCMHSDPSVTLLVKIRFLMFHQGYCSVLAFGT
ncbi:Hypothetical predicted protein, partial [Mytilus galloprovincialis]